MSTFVVIRKDGTEVEFRHMGIQPGSTITTRIEGNLLIVTDRYFRSVPFRLDEVERTEVREPARSAAAVPPAMGFGPYYLGQSFARAAAALDKIEGLEADLESAVEVVFARGGEEWVRLNYPSIYARLMGATNKTFEVRPEPAEVV